MTDPGVPHVPYAVPVVLLALALAVKAPTFLRARRDPDVRATTLLLLLATVVFGSVTPASIRRLNDLTGVANFAAPWVYSLLTAFCATCLTMIMRWREVPSERRRRRMRGVWLVYCGVIVALWVTFLLADVPEERVHDLDTFYARTPWMREHIVLYLVAHTVSGVVAAYLIWTWLSKVRDRWLRTGLVALLAGYASGLVFDALKLTAVAARWAGGDLDGLSTRGAPPFALLDAVLVALGFIVPQAGPYLRRQWLDRAAYRTLRPLWLEVRALGPAAAPARVSRWDAMSLRVLQRRQDIHDALLRLAPHFDHELYGRTLAAARADGHDAAGAHGIAGAVAVRSAVAAARARAPRSAAAGGPARLGAEWDDIESVARALCRLRHADGILRRAASAGGVAPGA